MSDAQTQVEGVLDLKAVEAQMMETHTALEGFIEKSNAEISEAGKASTETKSAIDALAEKVTKQGDLAVELGDKVADLQQSQTKHFEGEPEEKSIGEQFVECDQYKAFVERGAYGTGRMEVKTAIVNAVPSLTQPLTPGHRLDRVIKEPDRALRIRDILPVGRTDSNIVWFPKENTFTNAAAVVVGTASPIISAENIAKPESALTFTSDSEEVKTIAHWIPISKQALDDSNFLASYVDSRLMYGLKLKEDTELIVGSGLVGTITGLYTGRTAYTMTSPLTYTTKIDQLRNAKAQAHTANYEPDFVCLNPADWAEIELAKETGGLYIFSHPAGVIGQVIWGMRVVLSNSMASGTFLVGASMSAQIWDREDANLAISYEDSDNFQKNMVSVRAEERIALTIYNAGGLIGGAFA